MPPVYPAWRPVASVGAGRFRQGSDYRTIRPRGSGDWLVILTLDGRGVARTAGGAVGLPPGRAAVWGPDTPHDYGTDPAAGRWSLAWSHFQARPHWRPWLDWPGASDAAPGAVDLTDRATRREADRGLREAVRWLDAPQPKPQREAFALAAVERVLLWCDIANPASGGRPLDARVQRVIDHLADAADKPHDVASLARLAHLSPSRFAHLFREQTGLTPMRYLERVRLDRARRLLDSTALPVQQVAASVGFEDAFYFSRRFKRDTGFSPRAWRGRG